jgi:hypothetical protein
MLIRYYRKGSSEAKDRRAGESDCLETLVDSTGPAQRQLLLDFEEDQLCVVRQVARYGSIPGYRLFPRAWDEAEGEDGDGDEWGGCA